MFTGIITATSRVLSNKAIGNYHRLSLNTEWQDVTVGESIAVNGVCLTLIPSAEYELIFDLSEETLSKSTLGALQAGHLVNLERAMTAGDRFGGHIVTGHVDKTATIQNIIRLDNFVKIQLGDFTTEDLLYLLPKGSITVNGVSLTINRVAQGMVELMIIPHSLAVTNLEQLEQGSLVNIEFDYFAKIIARQNSLFNTMKQEVDL